MITLDDIEDFTDLTRDEIAAIAEHEHIPEADATLLADYLTQFITAPRRCRR